MKKIDIQRKKERLWERLYERNTSIQRERERES